MTKPSYFLGKVFYFYFHWQGVFKTFTSGQKTMTTQKLSNQTQCSKFILHYFIHSFTYLMRSFLYHLFTLSKNSSKRVRLTAISALHVYVYLNKLSNYVLFYQTVKYTRNRIKYHCDLKQIHHLATRISFQFYRSHLIHRNKQTDQLQGFIRIVSSSCSLLPPTSTHFVSLAYAVTDTYTNKLVSLSIRYT